MHFVFSDHFDILLLYFILLGYTKNTRRIPEAATETVFQNICSFLPGQQPFYKFSRMVHLFFEQTFLSQRTDTNFPGNPI